MTLSVEKFHDFLNTHSDSLHPGKFGLCKVEVGHEYWGGGG
jgi:hypothetical protein